MEQMSFFSEEKIAFPLSHEDVVELHKRYIDEGEKDEDAFTWKEIKGGYSYYFYGTKVMEHIATSPGKAKLRIKEEFGKEDEEEKEKGKYITVTPDSPDLLRYMEMLKKAKQFIFRNLVIEQFACCNDFEKCSDALKCLYPEDRFYNGCYYRRNLEAGKVFYGKNKNI